jgi:hypothetical protein
MRYRPNWGLLLLGALIVGALFTYPIWRTFIVVRTSGLDFSDLNQNQQNALIQIRRTQGANAQATSYYALKTIIPAPTQDYPTPGSVSQAVKAGQFIQIDAIHSGSGRATIYRNSADNSLTLRLDEFTVINGPGLRVYLCVTPTPKTAAEVKSGDYFLVSTLKGTIGNQNYELPPELQLARYRSVVVFSEEFGVVYTSAALN